MKFESDASKKVWELHLAEAKMHEAEYKLTDKLGITFPPDGNLLVLSLAQKMIARDGEIIDGLFKEKSTVEKIKLYIAKNREYLRYMSESAEREGLLQATKTLPDRIAQRFRRIYITGHECGLRNQIVASAGAIAEKCFTYKYSKYSSVGTKILHLPTINESLLAEEQEKIEAFNRVLGGYRTDPVSQNFVPIHSTEYRNLTWQDIRRMEALKMADLI